MRAELTGERGGCLRGIPFTAYQFKFRDSPSSYPSFLFLFLSFSAKAVYQLVQTFDTRPLRNFSAFVIIVAALFSLIIS